MQKFIDMVNNKTEAEKVRMVTERLVYLSVQLKDAAVSNSENKEKEVRRLKENIRIGLKVIEGTLDNICPDIDIDVK